MASCVAPCGSPMELKNPRSSKWPQATRQRCAFLTAVRPNGSLWCLASWSTSSGKIKHAHFHDQARTFRHDATTLLAWLGLYSTLPGFGSLRLSAKRRVTAAIRHAVHQYQRKLRVRLQSAQGHRCELAWHTLRQH